jgi:hypothetical protein
MNEPMIRVDVECYSGYKREERPLRFTIGSRTLEVSNVQDQWYSPSAKYFRVVANDGNIYILRHDEGQDLWTLEAYREREQTL